MASLVSCGTTRGERPFVPGTASIASELAGQVTALGCLGCKSPETKRQKAARGFYDISAEASGIHDLVGSFTAQPAEEMRGARWDAQRAAESRAFYTFVTACSLEGWNRYPNSRLNDYRHLMADSFSN
jgi:hypothetical protein